MSKTILIIDGDLAARARLRDTLVAHGYIVDMVDSAAEALAAFDYANWPLVIATFTPGDASGPMLLQTLRDIAPGIAVIMLGDREQATALAAMRGGAADYLPLPVDEEELVTALDRAWHLREQRAPSQVLQVGAAQCITETRQRRLVTSLAHEINNPLTPIIGMAEMLLEDLPPDHPGRAYAHAITAAAWRIRDVVRDLCGETEAQ